MADHLLSILRGTAPPPAAPTGASPIPRSPHEATSTPSLSRHDSASEGRPTSSASSGLDGHDSTVPRNPLEQLLRTFSQPRPSPSPLPSQEGAAAETDAEQAPAATNKDSATLLSLLKGSSSAGPAPPIGASPSPPTKPVTTSPLLSPRGGNAKDLLGLLMGGSGPASPAAQEQVPAGASAPEEETSEEEATKEALQTGETLGLTGMQEAVTAPAEANAASLPTKTAATPVFTFVSPFDFLDSIRSPPRPTEASQPSAPRGENAAQNEDEQRQRDPQSLPTPVPTPTESVASPGPGPGRGDTVRRSFAASAPIAFVSAGGSVPSAPSPTSIVSTSEVGAQSNATTPPNGGGTSSTFPHEYLASAYIPPTPAPAPSLAPLGVRLPRRASLPPNAPQHLTISTSDPHYEALVPSPPEVTPIALFSVPAEDRWSLTRTRTAGIWEHGIAYASAAGSGKHRIRVIDRESGAKVLLKGKRDEKEVVDLQIDRSSRDGQRRIACVANGGALSVWQVPDRFDNEAEASKQCVCTILALVRDDFFY